MAFQFPTFQIGNKLLTEGTIIKPQKFCSGQIRNSCQKYYQSIAEKNGFHVCPYGFASYVTKNCKKIVTCLLIEGIHKPKKIKNKISNRFNPKFPQDIIISYVQKEMEIEKERNTILSQMQKSSNDRLLLETEVAEQKDFLNSLFHEIRKLNTQVKSQAEEASGEISKKDEMNIDFLKYRIGNIFATSSLISVRLNSYDIHANPSLILTESKQSIEVYKKFEKVKHCLHTMLLAKKLKINFIGESYHKLEGYSIFEILPFLLFENAIKFSHNDSEINVFFENYSMNDLKIIIESFGPQLYKDEIKKIFEAKYRGQNAKKISSGTGTGLSLAKTICYMHDIEINVEQNNSRTYHIDNIPYSRFKVILEFNNLY